MLKVIDCQKLDLESYNKFLDVKLSPYYKINKRLIEYENDKIEYSEELIKNEECHLFDYQKFILKIAIEKKRYAIFADCGLGKTAIFLAYINQVKKLIGDKKILIISPLAVIPQTIEEEFKFYKKSTIKDMHNLDIKGWLDTEDKIAITNYDKFHEKIDFRNKIGAIILDESSILKNEDGKIRNSLIESFRGVPFKLCCSATPAPNDREEYANHSTFLEYTRSNNEYYCSYFINKDNGWQIKPNGLKHFFKNLSEWSIYLRNPENFGFINNIKDLPKPEIKIIDVELTEQQKSYLSKDLNGNFTDIFSKKIALNKISKGFIENKEIDTNKIKAIEEIINQNKDSSIMIWTTFNKEEELLKKYLIKKGYLVESISGSTPEESRAEIITKFRHNGFKILISKPKLLGFGVNLPFVDVQIFNGLNDSYEQFYQAIRRSYRYGSTKKLNVYIPITKIEQDTLSNVLNKRDRFEEDSLNQESNFIINLENNIKEFRGEIMEKKEEKEELILDRIIGDKYKIYRGDSIKILRDLPEESIDLSVFSPPFSNLFTYSEHIEDMGNSRDGNEEFNLHFEYFLKGLERVMKKGRLVCCHLSQLSTFKGKEGYVGLKDFRGVIIELFQKNGFVFFGEWVIKKNPQMQAIKEKVRSLSFAQMERNRLGSRSGLSDFVLVFKKIGETNDIVNDDSGCTRDEWINWASGVWTDINESDTLNVKGTKNEDDVKHICPLNLEVIRRCIRLYTNRGELVLDPFNGIGSTGVISLGLDRKYIGIELKEEYFEETKKNLLKADKIDIDSIKKNSLRKTLDGIDIKSDNLNKYF